MFIQAIIFAIIIGYILKGRMKNFEAVDIKGLYAVTFSFILQFIVIMLIRKGFLQSHGIIYILHLFMYILLFYFVYLNKQYLFIVIMGVGFLLNALPIFFNGGLMPVDVQACRSIGLIVDVTKLGMYKVLNSGTRLWFLSDIIPKNFITKEVISIGDLVIAIGLMLFMINIMLKKNNKNLKTE